MRECTGGYAFSERALILIWGPSVCHTTNMPWSDLRLPRLASTAQQEQFFHCTGDNGLKDLRTPSCTLRLLALWPYHPPSCLKAPWVGQPKTQAALVVLTISWLQSLCCEICWTPIPQDLTKVRSKRTEEPLVEEISLIFCCTDTSSRRGICVIWSVVWSSQNSRASWDSQPAATKHHMFIYYHLSFDVYFLYTVCIKQFSLNSS